MKSVVFWVVWREPDVSEEHVAYTFGSIIKTSKKLAAVGGKLSSVFVWLTFRLWICRPCAPPEYTALRHVDNHLIVRMFVNRTRIVLFAPVWEEGTRACRKLHNIYSEKIKED
jgi:hypothetical protein